ncbi:unnamed protein product, partial [Mesorhabditis belari]|uniref:Uncharacterized protein n=1 Tax=Mesorhabditis belari TaxID=2138241 RepID=A0AAF3J7L5_9BILA
MADPHHEIVQMRQVVTQAKPNTTLYQIAMRYSGYYSSSDDEDSLFGSTGRAKGLHKDLLQKSLHQQQKENGNVGEYVEVRSSRPSSRVIPPDVTQNAGRPLFQPFQSNQSNQSNQSDYMVMNGTKAEIMLRRVEQIQTRNEQKAAEIIANRLVQNGKENGNGVKERERKDEGTPRNADIRASIIDDVVYVNTQPQTTLIGSPDSAHQDYENALILKPTRVSKRIQQMQHNLQRPKTKPLQEFYNDDDAELEAMARVADPCAPRAEGATMTPVRGDGLTGTTAHTLPKSVDSALHRYGTTAPKAIAAVVLDQHGKLGEQLTYGKLLSRSSKVAYMLLNKQVPQGGRDAAKGPLCRPGDRIALVYPNSDPLHFLPAFYGCLLAGVIPVPVEVPLSKRDAGIQQLGFLLGSCGVKVALTSEACYKGLPKAASPNGSNTEVVDFKGWPRLYWQTTENLGKPSRDWTAPPRVTDESVAYIEYSQDREGAVKGVCVSRQAMLAHCRAITLQMDYKEGDTAICVLDWKREVGLWHAVLASVFCGMRVIFVPYSLMKINPASWMIQATKLQASAALVKSRDLHWALLATRDHKDVNFASLRSLVVADGANPWSLSSCDQFVATFSSRGLRPDAMCPTAGSSETGTISLRRRATSTQPGTQSGRGILSMSALSHGVVRVEQENALNSLTLQDAGQVIPGGSVVVVKQTGAPRLCKADEIGEICVCAHSGGHAYWGLEGISASTFRVEPLASDDRPLGPLHYVRSGLIGFMGPDGLIFVVGKKSSQLFVSGRQHSADDIIATVLAVEPMRFVYRGRIAVFSINVLRDERIVVVCEQKPNTSEDDAFQWMSRVLQAVESIHQVAIYCLALVVANQLPKTPLGGIHVAETRQRFLSGELHPATLLMCPHNCVLNLPKPRERQSDVGPAAMYVGNIVQGVRMGQADGRSLGGEDTFASLADILRQRAAQTPDHIIYSLVTNKTLENPDSLTCGLLLKRAERIASLLTDKARLNAGDHVSVVLPPGLELIVAFFGCLVAGMVPVCVRPPPPGHLSEALPTIRAIVDVSRSVAVLSSQTITKLLKSKEASHRVDTKAWPLILDIEDAPSSAKRKGTLERETVDPRAPAYLDFAVSTTGQLTGVIISQYSASTLCKSLKIACELYQSRHVSVCLDPYSGLGLALWSLSSVYSGHHTTLIPPSEVETSPSLWLQTVSNGKMRDTFTSHTVIETCVKELAPQVAQLKEKGLNLSCVRTCVVVAEERPRVPLLSAFSTLFSTLGLSPRAISTSFGTRVCPAICMQGASGPDPAQIWVDGRSLRHDRVSVVGKGAPHSIALVETGKLLPGVRVVIANPETRGVCADSHLGEIWVSSSHNADGTLDRHAHNDTFEARLTTGDTKTRWARTGYLGLVRQTDAVTESGGLHEAVFVVGPLEETITLRGMRYHPSDIEYTLNRGHRLIGESAVFTWNHLLVAVVECSGGDDSLDVVPAATGAVLEEHHLILGVVVIVDPNTIPTNCRGEKQRYLLRDQFLQDKLDPIYVAYNM